MAAIVSHGSVSHQPGQMHPFFRHSHTVEGPASNLSESKPSGLTSHVNSVIDTRAETGFKSPTALNSISNGDNPSDAQVMEQDIDSNSDRRKRRKLTPSPPEDRRRLALKRERNADGGIQQNQIEQVNGGFEHSTPTSIDAARMESQISLTTQRSPRISISMNPEEKRDMLPEAVSAPASQADRIKNVEDHHSPTPTQDAKKILRLTSKGKLVKTPTPSPTSKSKRTGTRNSESTEQVRLRRGRIVLSRKLAIKYALDNDQSRRELGQRIDDILSGQLRMPEREKAAQRTAIAKDSLSKPDSRTHPFFLGKSILKDQANLATPSTDGRSTREASIEPSAKPPVPWNEIKFGTTKLAQSKDVGTRPAPWPPLDLQHVQPTSLASPLTSRLVPTKKVAKQKQELARVPDEEDVFRQYTFGLPKSVENHSIYLPDRLCMDHATLVATIDNDRRVKWTPHHTDLSLQRVRAKLSNHWSAFDQGKASGPQDWVHAYSPSCADEVFQPQARVLYEWLNKLKVHQVQSKLHKQAEASSKRGRKRKPKRHDDLDDFVVTSEDEGDVHCNTNTKNVIVITGPSGCGKTAAVYAVARELDFEVFEIHPGMRRTARDIFDKVGDMTLNHLVQPSAGPSRELSELSEGDDPTKRPEITLPKNQSTVRNVFGKTRPGSKEAGLLPSEKVSTQKQSLILFEEVDILFDEDKSFWAGVQALAHQSKRPIVLTCNRAESVPSADLDIHDTLSFERPAVEDVVEYLAYMAASEGHIVEREDLKMLYLGRGQDLRASITDLNFWCQMTVGSELGGLDWMHDGIYQSKKSRIISKRTFHHGLDLLPEVSLVGEDLMMFSKESFDMSILDWEDTLNTLSFNAGRDSTLSDLQHLAEVRSCMDVVDDSTALLLSTAVSSTLPHAHRQPCRRDIIDFVSTQPQPPPVSRSQLLEFLEPIMEDQRTFPPTTGRAATSIDGGGETIVTEVAPYVRAIVAFDQNLEMLRSELGGGSQGARQRKTRAARAALEGGDKANTRRERWFPEGLDFDRILATSPCGEPNIFTNLSSGSVDRLPASQVSEAESASGYAASPEGASVTT